VPGFRLFDLFKEEPMRSSFPKLPSLATTLLLCLAGSASASSDFGCSSEWKVDAEQPSLCNNWPFLSPANDSRVNIRLLLDVVTELPLSEKLAQGDEPLAPLVPFDLYALHAAEAETAAPRDHAAELDALLAPLDLNTGDLALQVFAEDEGTRCRSNDLPSANAFIAAMAQDGLPLDARRILARQRMSLLLTCGPGEGSALETAELAEAPEAAPFLRYLKAAEAFYQGDLAEATDGFASLHDSPQPWLRETSRYLSGRVLLNVAQEGALDEYGYLEPQQVDASRADAAVEALQAYLIEYPEGQYFASARGLLRKLHWLKRDHQALAAEFVWQWQQPAQRRNRSFRQLIDEFDDKLLFSIPSDQAQDPLLLGVLDLMALRRPWDERERLPRERFEQQKRFFMEQPGLYRYLDAAHQFYGEQNPAAALAILPARPQSGPLGTLAFSEQTLRGLALERLGQREQAREHWRALLDLSRDGLQREQSQLALAMNLERSERLAEVFAADSPIDSQPIRLQLLRYVAGPALLREELRRSGGKAREALLYALLYKDLLRGHYADFVSDSAAFGPLPADSSLAVFAWSGDTRGAYSCPDLQQLAKQLAAEPENAGARLCLGDWVRTNDLRYSPLAERPAGDELGGSAELFPGQGFSRLQAYQAVIASPDAAAQDRAYALYRAVYCFAPGGNNDCDAQEIAPEQRKEWFHQLKREYPQSHWAQSLKYYW